MRKKGKHGTKKKFEFSKLIFTGVSIATTAVVIFSCRMIYINRDLSPLAYLIPSVFAELATATASIITKQRRKTSLRYLTTWQKRTRERQSTKNRRSKHG